MTIDELLVRLIEHDLNMEVVIWEESEAAFMPIKIVSEVSFVGHNKLRLGVGEE